MIDRWIRHRDVLDRDGDDRTSIWASIKRRDEKASWNIAVKIPGQPGRWFQMVCRFPVGVLLILLFRFVTRFTAIELLRTLCQLPHHTCLRISELCRS